MHLLNIISAAQPTLLYLLPATALWEQTMQIVLDTPESNRGGNPAAIGTSVTEDFTCVYSKQWSAANMAGGMAFQK